MQTFMNIGIWRKSITTQSPITIQFQSSLKNRPSAAPLRLLHLFEKDFSCPNYKVDHQLSLSPSFFLLQLFNIGNLCDHFPIPIIGSYRWEGWVGSVFLPSVQVLMIRFCLVWINFGSNFFAFLKLDFGCIWQQISNITQKNLLTAIRVLENYLSWVVSFAKNFSGRIKFWVGFWPYSSLSTRYAIIVVLMNKPWKILKSFNLGSSF